MKILIEKIVNQLDPVMIESEVGKIRDINLDMDDIRVIIDGLKEEMNVWEKLNPFSQSEEKKELKYHKGELRFYQKEYDAITNQIRGSIRSVIQSTPSLRMKATVSDMQRTVDNLRSKLRLRQNQSGKNHSRAREIGDLEKQIHVLDVLLENEFGFTPGRLSENEMTEIVLREILNKNI